MKALGSVVEVFGLYLKILRVFVASSARIAYTVLLLLDYCMAIEGQGLPRHE
jgi:hypothetical protein